MNSTAAGAVVSGFLGKVVTQIINPLILLLATLSFVVFLWGAFQFVANAGEEAKRTEGRRAILWGLVGLVIIFGVYGILNLVLGTFGIAPVHKITG